MPAPVPQLVAVDIVVFNRITFSVLAIRRRNAPFKGCLALPGGFVEPDETTEAAARRELHEETGLEVDLVDLRLVGVYSMPDRDPRGRVISVAYFTNTWNGKLQAGDDAASAEWVFIGTESPKFAFDHGDIVRHAFPLITSSYDRSLHSF